MPRACITKLATLIVALLALTHCNPFQDIIEQKIKEARPGVIPEPEPEPVDPDPLEINSILPNRGEAAGGDAVQIVGVGFEEGARVFFGLIEADPALVEVATETRIDCVTPANSAGFKGIRVIRGAVTARLDNAFEYFDPVVATSIAPDRAVSSGGDRITVFGEGFVDGSIVRLQSGGVPLSADVLDPSSLRVQIPPTARGLYPITVENRNGADTLAGALTIYDPLSVTGIVPSSGPLGGGTSVLVTGTGIQASSTVMLGDQVLTGTTSTSETEFAAVTGSPNPLVEGVVDLLVTNDDGEALLKNAFVFFDATDTTPRIIDVLPAAGLIDGNAPVTIVGSGFNDGPVTVTFGGTPATCSVINDNVLECTTPPSNEGDVNLEIQTNATVITGTFRYLDLQVDAVIPSNGAQAGGTYIQITGKGFDSTTVVFVGGEAATDVQAESDTLLSFRTPRGNLGLAPVTVETQGVPITTNDAFDYFDPADTIFWTSGGTIDIINRDVNITVTDRSGTPIEDAYVILGADPLSAESHESGRTDDRGQITISGPEVLGPVDVHGGKTGYTPFSWIDVNARNLKVQLMRYPPPPPDPPPDCPSNAGAFPPIIRGVVKRIKDEFNTGDDVIKVTTTQVNLSIPLPDPGPNAEIMSQGPYEMVARTGEMVVIAEAGHYDANGDFQRHSLGFAPFITTQTSTGDDCAGQPDVCTDGEECTKFLGFDLCMRIYDVDVLVDTPLVQDLEILFDDPPLGSFPGVEADSTYARVHYDFNSMGVYRMGDTGDLMADRLTLPMPESLPQEIEGTQFVVLGQLSAGGSYPISQTTSDGIDTTEPLLLTPLLKTFQVLEPTFALTTTPRLFDVAIRPSSIPEIYPTANYHEFLNVDMIPGCLMPDGTVIAIPQANYYWRVLTSPLSTGYRLPLFPPEATGANFPINEALFWVMQANYAPQTSYNSFDFQTFLRGRSVSVNVEDFSVP